MKVRLKSRASLARFALGPVGRTLIVCAALFTILGVGAFTYFYAKYSRLIDEKLNAGPFANTAKIFAGPESIAVGDVITTADIAAQLRRSGYNESPGNPIGYYQVRPDVIEIFPGRDSYFDQEAGKVRFAGGKISQRSWRAFSVGDSLPQSRSRPSVCV